MSEQKQEALSRKATVLYLTFSGFHEMETNSSFGEIAALLGRCFSFTDPIIRLYSGKPYKYMGESAMAFFGLNEDGKRSSVNAVKSAIELQNKFSELISENEFPGTIGFKIGIYSGEIFSATIGTGAEQQENYFGEALQLAAHICSLAMPGQILVGEETRQHASTDFTFNALEPVPVKGYKKPLPIFEPLTKKHKKLDLKISPQRKIVSEMVGRSSEMEQLEGLIRNLAAGKGSIVNIVGKAGIGKSRLMAEMKAQPLMDKVLLLEGRAVSTGQNLSFHPITNLIKSWAGITEEDLPSVSSEKLFQGIKRNTAEQADEIYAFLATMMGLPLEGKNKERVKGIEGEALEKLILKNLRDLIIAATKDKPRIYMIEDLHWADSSSITLFESLYKLSEKYPVMFINVMRPGYKETGDYILKYLVDNFPGDHNTINVNPLEETESGNLIKNLLREAPIPEEIQKMIVRKTEGNPFFIEEIIRSFIDEEIIDIQEGNFIVTEKIKDVNIPETINEAILSRVDKLDEKTRELLNTASVMGRNFYYKVLEEATDTIEELDERLAYLTQVQLITETKKKEEIEYLFKHALAQQLTYDAMMQQSRKEIHFKIARSIEKVFAANIHEFYGTLVYHYELAEDEEKAIYFMLLAGEEAMRSGASSEALRFFERALDALPEQRKNDPQDNEIRDLRINIANLYHALGRNFESVELFEYIFEKYFNYRVAKTEKGIMLRGIWGMVLIAFAFRFPRLFFRKSIKKEDELICTHFVDWGTPISTINPRHFVFKPSDAVRRFIKYDPMGSQAVLDLYIQISCIFLWASFSYPTSRKIIDLVDQADFQLNPRPLLSLLMTKSMFNINTGKWHYNIDADEVFNTGIKTGELWMTSVTALYLGMQQTELGNYARTIEISDKLKELGNSFENSFSIAQGYRVRFVCLMKFRKFEQLQPLLDEARNYMHTTDNKLHAFLVDIVQSHLHIHNNDLDAAVKSFEEAKKSLEIIKSIPSYYTPYLIAKIHLGLALMNDKRNKDIKNNQEIRELLKASKKLIAKSKKFVSNLTEAYLLRSRIFMFQQKSGKAFKNLQLAIATGEKYQSRLEHSRACFETGKFLSDPNNRNKELNGNPAGYYLEKAKAMFEEMDLQWDLKEYEQYMET
ncbi:MAG: AAA family ATPase [Bacteroidales bacterium]|nr:AAA family ATPase [Bacteroidales bacterium]